MVTPERPEVVITHLQMLEAPSAPAPPTPPGCLVMQAHDPSVAFYRFLYNQVGAPWQWTDRNVLPEAALAQLLADPRVALHVLYVRGAPAGYIELDYRAPAEAQIGYFGLMPAFIGRGLGRFLLAWGVAEAWRRPGVRRLWVHTCTLDHPGALPLYQALGFRPFKVEKKRTIPPPAGANPA